MDSEKEGGGRGKEHGPGEDPSDKDFLPRNDRIMFGKDDANTLKRTVTEFFKTL